MRIINRALAIAVCLLLCVPTVALAKRFVLNSPDGNIQVTVEYNKDDGTVSYKASREDQTVIASSPLGIKTDKVNFSTGLHYVDLSRSKIDNTYSLPVGKVSTYVNRANQLQLAFTKERQKYNVIFRAYNEGIAFRYAIPGEGDVDITGETTGFSMPGEPDFWGQKYPNKFGNENPLGKIEGSSFSLPLLCEWKDPKRWVLLSQAATHSNYVIPHLKKDGRRLQTRFPINQNEPVNTKLPIKTPWRVAVVSPRDLSVIVEQTLHENLNPPTEPSLRNADWIQPGSTTFDWFHDKKKNVRDWIDGASKLNWEYHLVDAGWENYVDDLGKLVQYGKNKGVGIFVWKAVGDSPIDGTSPAVQTEEEIEAFLQKMAKKGVKGVKFDFFDRLGPGGGTTADMENTQIGLQVRDKILRIAAEHRLQVVLHGSAVPTGERRRWPHLLSTEGVRGQEHNPSASHDVSIPFIRNPLGPVDYSPTWFGKGGKTNAYQLATSVVFESGLLIYADYYKNYLNHKLRTVLEDIPANWDEIEFVEGYPASHAVIARRTGDKWFVGGMTVNARTVSLPLDFLVNDRRYRATVIKDREQGRKAEVESREVDSSGNLTLPMREKGGFVVRFVPVE